MTIAKILVPVSGGDGDEAAIATAVCAAQTLCAHVAVLCVHEDPARAVPLVGVPLSAETVGAIVDGQTLHAAAAAAHARQALEAVCARASIPIAAAPERFERASCSFGQCLGEIAAGIARAAALSDLVVLNPIAWRSTPQFNAAFLDVLREVRRPVLVARRAPPERFGRIVIGWDGGAAAANAVHGAMDLLARAERVTIVSIGRNGEPGAPARELTDYLARHGIASTARAADAGRGGPAAALLREAAGADLIVAGAYGHDHLREALFGGTTETLAGNAGIPVLLAH